MTWHIVLIPHSVASNLIPFTCAVTYDFSASLKRIYHTRRISDLSWSFALRSVTFRLFDLPYLYSKSKVYRNIPILPEAFLTFASKSSCGPSYDANGQKDHKTSTMKKKKKNMVKP